MKAEFIGLLQKAGYRSQAELARALVGQGLVHGSYRTAQAYLCQIVAGKRPASKIMLSGLSALLGEEIENFVRVPFNDRRTTLERGLENFLAETYSGLKNIFSQADPTDKMKMCMDFKHYVDNYTQSKDEDVTPQSSKP